MRGNPEIRRWGDNKIIIPAGKYRSLKEAVEKRKKDLSEARLEHAELQGANLKEAFLIGANLQHANLKNANLEGANLEYVNLRGANLIGANLKGAFLLGANLQEADLQDANLQEAEFCDTDIRGANLKGANLKGNITCLPALYSLKMLPSDTILHFWKPVIKDSYFYSNQDYEVGKTYEFDDYETDERLDWGKGRKSNVATLLWCLQNHRDIEEFVEVEFKVKDIIAIPYTTAGNFGVRKFKVVRKVKREEAEKILKKEVK